MKKIITVSVFVFVFLFVGLVTVKASTCGLQDDNTIIPCGNGPTVPLPVGFIHYNPGQGGCPAWFAWGYPMGCMGLPGLK